MANYVKTVWIMLGGMAGWLVGVFMPAFPLIIVAVAFILWDAWAAYQLDKRVKVMYPDKTKRRQAKFSSFAFGKVVRKTIPERLVMILLAFLAEKYVFVHVTIPLSYIATGCVLFEQSISVLENNASCPIDKRDSRFWIVLRKVLIDKTERHFDVSLGDLGQMTEEQIESMRRQVREWDEKRKPQQDMGERDADDDFKFGYF
jgi:hypothetical protein